MELRKKQHRLHFGKENNAVGKYMGKNGHEIVWDGIFCLEAESRMYPRKILVSHYMRKKKKEKANCYRYMNLSDRIHISAFYRKGKEADWEEKEEVGEREARAQQIQIQF